MMLPPIMGPKSRTNYEIRHAVVCKRSAEGYLSNVRIVIDIWRRRIGHHGAVMLADFLCFVDVELRGHCALTLGGQALKGH
eukprot:scaffold5017_cov105-Skeletonema_dohrnii-CCMP3373.AAC.1